MEPGGLQGLAHQPGGHRLPLVGCLQPPQLVAHLQNSIKNPHLGPEELLLQPGQTGKERDRGTEIGRGTENGQKLSQGPGPEVQGGGPGPEVQGGGPGPEVQGGEPGPEVQEGESDLGPEVQRGEAGPHQEFCEDQVLPGGK